MYNYEYEVDVLLFLRLAKYLHQQNPEALRKILERYPDFDLCQLYELAGCVIWEICTQAVFDVEHVVSEDSWEQLDVSFCTFDHPLINRFCELSADWCGVRDQSVGAWQSKLADIVMYFLDEDSHSICRLECYPMGDSARIRVWLSPDCYEPAIFGNALVDMLLFLQRENQRLEGLLKEAEQREEAA